MLILKCLKHGLINIHFCPVNVFHNKQEVRNKYDRKETHKRKEKIIPSIVSILFEIEKCKSLLISTSNRYSANILCIFLKSFLRHVFFL